VIKYLGYGIIQQSYKVLLPPEGKTKKRKEKLGTNFKGEKN
jgi:hypothetical protein